MTSHLPLEPARPVARIPDLETSLDFINTLEHSRDGDEEHLPSPSAADDWLRGQGVGAAGRTVTDIAGLQAIRDSRAAMREVVDAVIDERAPERSAVERLNRLLDQADTTRLVAVPTGVVVSAEHRADALADALAHLVEPLVELLREGDVGRLRRCDNEHCRWVFFDESRTGRRRWCDMGTCGNRAKAARHRAKLRANEGLARGGA